MAQKASGKTLNIIGAASGLGAPDQRCANGPTIIWKNVQTKSVYPFNSFNWSKIVTPDVTLDPIYSLSSFCYELADTVIETIDQDSLLAVIGGDHACAVGTWSGVVTTYRQQGPVGLIWIDAHMDAHTPASSPRGFRHGMPVATLLGRGAKDWMDIGFPGAKFLPEHIVLVGVRSYEAEEIELLNELGVRFYTMDDVQRIGFHNVMREARERVCTGTVAYGISVDLDGLTPIDAPGVGTPVVGGIAAESLLEVLDDFHCDEMLIALEIAEFNPVVDVEQRTQMLVMEMLARFAGVANDNESNDRD